MNRLVAAPAPAPSAGAASDDNKASTEHREEAATPHRRPRPIDTGEGEGKAESKQAGGRWNAFLSLRTFAHSLFGSAFFSFMVFPAWFFPRALAPFRPFCSVPFREFTLHLHSKEAVIFSILFLCSLLSFSVLPDSFFSYLFSFSSPSFLSHPFIILLFFLCLCFILLFQLFSCADRTFLILVVGALTHSLLKSYKSKLIESMIRC